MIGKTGLKMKTDIYRTLYVLAISMIMIVGVLPAHAADSSFIRLTFLNQDPDPAESGKYLELRWKVEKLGSAQINDLVFELQLEYPFYFDGADNAVKEVERWLGSTIEDEYYILYYKIRVDNDALEGEYDATLRYKSADDSGWKSEDYTLRVGERKNSNFVLGNLVTSPKKLIADIEEARIDVDIANIGDANAENVLVEIDLPEGIMPNYGYSDRATLGTIQPGVPKTATFYVDTADYLAGGTYMSYLNISYKEEEDDENEYKNILLPLEIPIKDSARFEIASVETTPEKIYPGSEVTMRINVLNKGGDEADSVSLKLFKEATQPFEFDEKSDFIGKMRSGDSGEAVLTFTVDEDAKPKSYLFDLEIRGVDGQEVIVDSKSMSINIEDGAASGLGGNGIFLTVAISVIVGIVGFSIGKKSRK
ncbi:MAG: COG1361 S-layer family protein [Candidatus Woesearchaeota archaeon]